MKPAWKPAVLAGTAFGVTGGAIAAWVASNASGEGY